jgi:hypothetical protein
MFSIFFITTASLAAPAACASETLKTVCLFLVKADCDIDRDRVIRTSCVLVEADVVVPEVVGGVQVLSDQAPVDTENVPGGHFAQSKATPILGD